MRAGDARERRAELRADAMLGLLALAVAVLTLVAAFWLPTLLFSNDAGDMTRIESLKLTTPVRHTLRVPPLRLQIIRVEPTSSQYDFPNAELAWRTIFGVRYATTTTSRGQTHTDWHSGRFAATWTLFLLYELALVALGIALLIYSWAERAWSVANNSKGMTR